MDVSALNSASLSWETNEPVDHGNREDTLEPVEESHAWQTLGQGIFDWLFSAPPKIQPLTSLKEMSFEAKAALDVILGSKSAFLIPKSADRSYFIALIKTLVSQPKSRALLLELATCDRKIELEASASSSLMYLQEYNDKIIVKMRNDQPHYAYVKNDDQLEVEEIPDYIVLAHELIHAYHITRHESLNLLSPSHPDYTNLEEENTIIGVPGFKTFTENDIREEFGLLPRYGHRGLKEIFDSEQDINSLNDLGQGMLTRAIHWGTYDDIVKCLSRGADLFQEDKEGNTPLHYAVLFHREGSEILATILAYAQKTHQAIAANQVIPVASSSRNLSALKVLVDHGFSLNTFGNDGLTPLQHAVLNRDLSMIKFLLNKKCDPYQKGLVGQSALEFALQIEDSEIIKLLNLDPRKALSDKSYLEVCKRVLFSSNIEAIKELIVPDRMDQKSLEALVTFGLANGLFQNMISIPALKVGYLKELEKDDTFWKTDPYQNYLSVARTNPNLSPICYAAHLGSVPFASALIKRGANLNELRYTGSENPLMIAAFQNNKEMLHFFLSQGASGAIKDMSGNTFAHYLAKLGTASTIAAVLRKDDLKEQNNKGFTPLHIVIYENLPLNKVQVLLDEDVINMQDNDGCTPLHVAIICGRYDVAKYLLEHGADPSIEDYNCDRALDVARHLGDERMIELLASYQQLKSYRDTAYKLAV